MAADREPFFIGWAAPAAPLRDFLIGVALGLVLLLSGLAWLTAASQSDPGDGSFRGRAEAIGVIEAEPYPILHVTESETFAPGTALLLSGVGKVGVQERAAALDGQIVAAAGLRLARGDLEGLQLRGGEDGLRAAEGNAAPPAREPLGRWRVTGEICDGKCYLGAMRPGRGLAHKACANFCLIGGVPPLIVATGKIDGTEYLLPAGADGGPITEALLDHTATLIEVEGEVERRGALLVFRIDPETLRLSQ